MISTWVLLFEMAFDQLKTASISYAHKDLKNSNLVIAGTVVNCCNQSTCVMILLHDIVGICDKI